MSLCPPKSNLTEIPSWVKSSYDETSLLDVNQSDLDGLALHSYFSQKRWAYIVPRARNVSDPFFLAQLRRALARGDDSDEDSGDEAAVKCKTCKGSFSSRLFSTHVKECGAKVSSVVFTESH